MSSPAFLAGLSTLLVFTTAARAEAPPPAYADLIRQDYVEAFSSRDAEQLLVANPPRPLPVSDLDCQLNAGPFLHVDHVCTVKVDSADKKVAASVAYLTWLQLAHQRWERGEHRDRIVPTLLVAHAKDGLVITVVPHSHDVGTTGVTLKVRRGLGRDDHTFVELRLTKRFLADKPTVDYPVAAERKKVRDAQAPSAATSAARTAWFADRMAWVVLALTGDQAKAKATNPRYVTLLSADTRWIECQKEADEDEDEDEKGPPGGGWYRSARYQCRGAPKVELEPAACHALGWALIGASSQWRAPPWKNATHVELDLSCGKGSEARFEWIPTPVQSAPHTTHNTVYLGGVLTWSVPVDPSLPFYDVLFVLFPNPSAP